jgi:hypothetical protein
VSSISVDADDDDRNTGRQALAENKDLVMIEIRAFKDGQEAIDVGFKEGVEDRQNGFQSEDLARELREPHKWLRGPGSPFYEDWKHAYQYGFRGLEKPKLGESPRANDPGRG